MKFLLISLGRLNENGSAGQAVSCGIVEAALRRGWQVTHLAVVPGPATDYEIQRSFDEFGHLRRSEIVYEEKPTRVGKRSFIGRIRNYARHLVATYDPVRAKQFSTTKPNIIGDFYDGVVAFEPLAIELAKGIASKHTIAILGDPAGRRIWHSSSPKQVRIKAEAIFWDVAEPCHYRHIIPTTWRIAMFGSGHAACWSKLLGRRVVDMRPPLPVGSSKVQTLGDKPVVLFGGTLTSTASRRSLNPIFEQIIPALRKKFGVEGFELRFVGDCPAPLAAQAARYSEVRTIGRVRSFEDELARGHVFLLPMNYPVGVRARLCSALAAGNVCIVHPSTTFNMPEIKSCPAVFIEHDFSRYATIVGHAVAPENFSKLRATARNFFDEKYRAEVAAAPLLDLIEERLH